MPYFSVIIPAYNRGKEIPRAIQSCLDQDFTDFEVVVTDDGSGDDTVEVVERFVRADQRVRLLRHRENRGVCPARNTAAAAARGDWLVLLDSDQALCPGSLSALARRTAEAAADVGNVAARVVWDTGIVTPCPTIPAEALGYEQYVAWVNSLSVSEFFNCIRRRVWSEGIRWPDSRAHESLFHLNLVARWRFQIHPDICSVYYTDAPNRLCQPKDLRVARDNLRRSALDHARDAEEILAHHGRVLEQHAAGQVELLRYKAALYRFLCGHRVAGARHLVGCMVRCPWSRRLWFLAAFGFLGSRPFSTAYYACKFWLPHQLHRLSASCQKLRPRRLLPSSAAGSDGVVWARERVTGRVPGGG